MERLVDLLLKLEPSAYVTSEGRMWKRAIRKAKKQERLLSDLQEEVDRLASDVRILEEEIAELNDG